VHALAGCKVMTGRLAGVAKHSRELRMERSAELWRQAVQRRLGQQGVAGAQNGLLGDREACLHELTGAAPEQRALAGSAEKAEKSHGLLRLRRAPLDTRPQGQ